MVEIGIVIVIIAVGVWLGKQGTVPTRKPGSNQTGVTQCEDACDQFDARRAERCLAEQDRAGALENVTAIRDLLFVLSSGSVAVLLGAIAGASGAAALVAAVPVLAPIMPLILAVLATGFVVAAAAIIALAAALITAEADLGDKRRAATTVRNNEAEARNILL